MIMIIIIMIIIIIIIINFISIASISLVVLGTLHYYTKRVKMQINYNNRNENDCSNTGNDIKNNK